MRSARSLRLSDSDPASSACLSTGITKWLHAYRHTFILQSPEDVYDLPLTKHARSYERTCLTVFCELQYMVSSHSSSDAGNPGWM